jgi:hypothetical protein
MLFQSRIAQSNIVGFSSVEAQNDFTAAVLIDISSVAVVLC